VVKCLSMAAVYSVRLGAKQPSTASRIKKCVHDLVSCPNIYTLIERLYTRYFALHRKPKGTGIRSSVAFVGAAPLKGALSEQRRIKRVERELWQVFTYYTLASDPLNPSLMKISSFLAMLKDCGLMKPGCLMKAEVDLAVAVQLKQSRSSLSGTGTAASLTKPKYQRRFESRDTINLTASRATRDARAKRQNQNHLIFTDFLELLRNLAPKVYPESDPNQAWKRLFLEDILINGVRVLPFDDTVGKSQVNPIDDRCTFELIHRFAHALGHILEHYCGVNDVGARHHEIAAFGRRRSHMSSPQHSIGSSTMRNVVIDLSPTAANSTAAPTLFEDEQDVKISLRYNEYMEFITDFQLAKSVTLHDCAKAYLRNAAEYGACVCAIPDVDEPGFHRILVDLAMKWTGSLGCKPTVTKSRRIKGFMLLLWKTLQLQKQRGIEELHATNSFSNRFASETNLFGAALFDRTFRAMWEKDKFCNYLDYEEEHLDDSLGNALSPNLSTRGDYGQPDGNESYAGDWDRDRDIVVDRATPEGPEPWQVGIDDLDDRTVPITLHASELRQLFLENPSISDIVATCLEVSAMEQPLGPNMNRAEAPKSPQSESALRSRKDHEQSEDTTQQLAALLARAAAAGLSSPEVDSAKIMVAKAMGVYTPDQYGLATPPRPKASPRTYW
jgi:hypothetical protein